MPAEPQTILTVLTQSSTVPSACCSFLLLIHMGTSPFPCDYRCANGYHLPYGGKGGRAIYIAALPALAAVGACFKQRADFPEPRAFFPDSYTRASASHHILGADGCAVPLRTQYSASPRIKDSAAIGEQRAKHWTVGHEVSASALPPGHSRRYRFEF